MYLIHVKFSLDFSFRTWFLMVPVDFGVYRLSPYLSQIQGLYSGLLDQFPCQITLVMVLD